MPGLIKPINEELKEHHIESFLIKQVKRLKGVPYKFTSPSRRSVPDRLCAFPYGKIVFVECKAPGKEPTKLQWREIDKLRAMGHDVVVVYTYEEVNMLMIRIRYELKELEREANNF